MKKLMFVVLTVFLGGCANHLNSIPVAAAEDTRVVCKKEKPTGSNRPVKVCRPAADAIDQEKTGRDMRVLQQQSEIILNRPD